ncbi:MAG: DUF2240 family protein [Candidatus Helarchaeota archaeon]
MNKLIKYSKTDGIFLNTNLEDILNKLMRKTNASKEDIQKRIEEIKQDFGGLLSDEGALTIIAKEHDIEIEQDTMFFNRRLYINELEVGMRTVSIAGRVSNIFQVREFKKKSGSEGKVVNLILSDKTGSVRATLWNDHVNLVEDGSIKIGQIIELKNCYVKEGWKGENEINLGEKGLIELAPEVDKSDFPESTSKILKINEITPDLNNISIEGRIVEISEIKDITTRDGRQTKLQELIVADETGQIRVPVWGNRIEELGRLSKGDSIKLTNAYSRAGFGNSLDLNIGKLTNVEINPENVKVPEIEKLKYKIEKITSFSNKKAQIKINELTPESKNVNLIGKCIEIGDVREVANDNKVMDIILGDDTGTIVLSVWNDDIEKIKKGESYSITNGYVSTFKNRIQLNTGKFGQIEVSEQKITKVNMKKNISESEFSPIRKNIIDLLENQTIEVRGTIVDFYSRPPITYDACPNCSKKVSIENEEIICPNCGKIPNSIENLLVSFALDDGTSNIRVTAIGKNAESLLNIDSTKDIDTINFDDLLGLEKVITGRTQRNKFTEKMEIIVQKVEDPNVIDEIKIALEKI